MTPWESVLYLENGHLFYGKGFGAKKSRGGEAVFNTGMSGYQEILTDPSYLEQIVVMTYPHIGNTGINPEDVESRGLDAVGFVVREYCPVPSNWRSTLPLSDYLEKAGLPGIEDVDTRKITKILRDEGAQRAVIFPAGEIASGSSAETTAKELLRKVPSMEGQELVSRVSCKTPFVYEDKALNVSADQGTVVVYDYGAKLNILRNWAKLGFRVQVVPYNFPAAEAMKYQPKAIMLTNGPGDPATVTGAIEQIQSFLGKTPIFAICMGHQLLARALGYKTYKLKFGHHGINHPVKDLQTGKVLITSQNHGFAVRADDLKGSDVVLSHISLNDETVEGFRSEKLKLQSVQFHPESKPGPNDATYLFNHFVKGFLR